jgi:hypothetical protein
VVLLRCYMGCEDFCGLYADAAPMLWQTSDRKDSDRPVSEQFRQVCDSNG